MRMGLILLLGFLGPVSLFSSLFFLLFLWYSYLTTIAVIQGTVDADVDNRLTQSEVSKTVDFCLNAFKQTNKEQHQAVMDKVKSGANREKTDLANLSEDELQILHTIRARQMLSTEDSLTLKNFGRGVVDGIVPRLKQGILTLLKVEESDASQDLEFTDLFEFIKH